MSTSAQIAELQTIIDRLNGVSTKIQKIQETLEKILTEEDSIQEEDSDEEEEKLDGKNWRQKNKKYYVPKS